MTFYSIALFLHIVGALGFFVMLGLEWMSLFYLQRVSTIDSARGWLSTFNLLRGLGPISMGTILLSGFYMIYTTWGWVAWAGITLAAMVLLAVLAVALTGRRMALVEQAASAESTSLSPVFHQRLFDPVLHTSIRVRVAIALGIVFLMTVKPGLEGSLLTIGAAILLGLASAWPLRRQGQINYKESKNEI